MRRKFGTVDSLKALQSLQIDGREYRFFSLKKAAEKLGSSIHTMPYSIKILMENLLRFEDNKTVKIDDIKEIINGHQAREHEIAFYPSRVLMQDFTGVPAVVDLAAMRDAMVKLGGDPKKINPMIPVDLVIDHSLQIDSYAKSTSFHDNVVIEMERNKERYKFLRWGQQSFSNFRVVPPGTGICHQVNLEYLAQVVWTEEVDGVVYAYPDTLVGTDSHTTMINGLAVLGWGVGGIEAEAVMLGQPLSMLIPAVVGMKLEGKLKEGVTATDLVLYITNILRAHNVVGKFVEFYGDGITHLSLAHRATIANMAPEYGATCGFFPIDQETLNYLALTGKSQHQIKLVELYAKEQGLWHDETNDVKFDEVLKLDLATVTPSLAGPKRPQDRVKLSDVAANFRKLLPDLNKNPNNVGKSYVVNDQYKLKNGDVVIAAITSCTNTSNPYVMIGAGLLARNAVQKGLKSKPWIKTSFAPGSQVVTEYLKKANLYDYLVKLGFDLVGYGCTTCIGNSGPLLPEIEKVITENNLTVSAVLSGNRNFEGRIHPLVRANYLASPLLCIAYAIAGSIEVNILSEPIGKDANGAEVYLKDIWPSDQEISESVNQNVSSDMFKAKYADVFSGTGEWKELDVVGTPTYTWESASTYIKHPPYFEDMGMTIKDYNIENARILAILGDSVTTDHISPAGSIGKNSPAGHYLLDHGVEQQEFNSYGSRRGNHEVMMRATFANTRIKNKIVDGIEGGYTKLPNSIEVVSIYDAAMHYMKNQVPLVVFAGKEYGTGSSRDWAAKGAKLLGIKAVIAESFERIHRSNLVGMGVIPITLDGITVDELELKGGEEISIYGFDNLNIRQKLIIKIKSADGDAKEYKAISAIYTDAEVSYLASGGILQYVLKALKA